MGHHRLLVLCAAAGLIVAHTANRSLAVVSYPTAGSSYTQNFDSLPAPPTFSQNASLGNSPIGWTDDNTTPAAGNFSIPGWYLYHTTDQSAGEGGFNGHQRMRVGTGSANTGSFWSFGVLGTNPLADRALGNVTSTTINESFYGVRLRNNTGSTLGQFTLTYTGEQWRNGGNTTAQTVSFGYAVTPAAFAGHIGNGAANLSPLVTSVAPLGFTSLVNTATAAALDGNASGNRTTPITLTVGGFNWLPGEDLWLRWTDPENTGNDHGLAIDDVSISANVGVDINSAGSGLVSSASTWSDNQPPSSGKWYHVVNGHAVTLDGAFPAGSAISVENGSVDINSAGNNQFFPNLIVENGGSLTESVSGDFTLGTASSSLRLNSSVTFNGFEPGAKFTVATDVTGSGDLNFVSNGTGSEVILPRVGGHQGTIRFGGTGDTVRLQGPENFNIIEMNSTGANRLSYEATSGGSLLGNSLVFNTPGVLDHASNTDRLQGPLTLVANAPVTIDLTKPYPSPGTATDERRLLIGDSEGRLEGTADITINGMASAPAGGAITKNEFELGETQETPPITIDNYSGTITANDYIDLEIRHHVPSAKFVINSNARLEMGNQIIAATQSIRLGEVQVNSGGTLEVGFEQGSATVDGHHAYHLTLTAEGTRDGDLTLADGSLTRMQVNGYGSDQFDRISVQGDVSLNGTLDVLLNPAASTGTNPSFAPIVGDKFDIITIVPTTVLGDYNASGTVGPEDYDEWKMVFGNTVTAGTGADGNGNGVVDAADYVVWKDNVGQTSSLVGSVTGTFDAVTVTGPAGYIFGVNYTLTNVQLEVIGTPGASSIVAAVPEPSTISLSGLMLALLLANRRRRARAAA